MGSFILPDGWKPAGTGSGFDSRRRILRVREEIKKRQEF